MKQGFAIWLTGRPASGKSTIAAALKEKLTSEGIAVQALESDELRKLLTPNPTYSEEERDWFYDTMIYLGRMLADNGINVIFDATGNRKAYRDKARSEITRFAEVYVKCPVEVCIKRDPKGIYKSANAGEAKTVPGLGSAYEEPLNPEIVVDCEKESTEEASDKILQWIRNNLL